MEKKHFLTLKDYSKEEILELIALAKLLKAKKKEKKAGNLLKNKNIALIFEKPSTRTRCAFSVAVVDEGGYPEYLNANDIQLGQKESVQDTARVLGRMYDGIAYRGFSHKAVEELAQYSGVPVWNGLTDSDHPTQVLADFMTIQEHGGELNNYSLCYIGDGRNNVANALMIGASKVGMNFTVIAPKELWPENDLLETCGSFAALSGSKILVTDKIEDVHNVDGIYTDVWYSMGEEDQKEERIKQLKPYQVNKNLMKQIGKPNAIFLHCLPAMKGYEVTEEVFESEASVVFDEAENRLHTIKAIMVATLARV